MSTAIEYHDVRLWGMIHSKGASAAFQRKPKIFNIEKVPSKPLFHDFGKCFGDFLFKIPIAIDALMAQQRRGQTNTQLAQHVGRMYLRGKCNSRKPDSDSDDEDNHPEGIYEDFALHYAKCLNKRVGRALTFYRKIHGFPARSTDLPYNPRALRRWESSPQHKQKEVSRVRLVTYLNHVISLVENLDHFRWYNRQDEYAAAVSELIQRVRSMTESVKSSVDVTDDGCLDPHGELWGGIPWEYGPQALDCSGWDTPMGYRYGIREYPLYLDRPYMNQRGKWKYPFETNRLLQQDDEDLSWLGKYHSCSIPVSRPSWLMRRRNRR